MPFYDYIYNTMDNSTDELYERTLKGTEETPELVHLTHMTTLRSTYHLRVGIASIASRPSDNHVWYMWMIWPVAWLSMVLAWVYGSSAFVVESLTLMKLKMQTWAIPRYNFHVMGLTVLYESYALTVLQTANIFFLSSMVWFGRKNPSTA